MTAVPLPLTTLEIGSGRVRDYSRPERILDSTPQRAFRFLFRHALLELAPGDAYGDAQLDDTRGITRNAFLWRPPVRFSLRARSSVSAPKGTFGFGFWNDPFAVSLGNLGAARKLPMAPQCAWFFYGSPPLDLPLAPGVPGRGWKAATLRSRKIPLPLLAPLAAGGISLAAIPPFRRFVFSAARRFYTAREAVLAADPAKWHEYAIDWLPGKVRFAVDGVEVLRSVLPPLPPLGLVLWMDNQYAVASPNKGFGFGVLPIEHTQSLELEDARMETPLSAC